MAMSDDMRMSSHELQVYSYKLRYKIYKLQAASYTSFVAISVPSWCHVGMSCNLDAISVQSRCDLGTISCHRVGSKAQARTEV
mmetsp:Transcript_70951/g.117905  ORF Transcript_70951/g.117905 Transcript_70951/m.117905 type:complete len:83 (-) Transcript_70951:271-519(-)